MVTEAPVYDKVLLALRRIIRAIDLHSKSLAVQHGLTGPQLILMKELGNGESATIGKLARSACMSSATASGIVSRLESRGLVERVRSSSDRRRVVVTLTGAGKGILKGVPSLLQDKFVREFDKLREWEQNLILSSLQRVGDMMSASDLEATPMLVSGPIEATVTETAEFLGEKVPG